MRSGDGSKCWYIFVNEATGLKQSIFTESKKKSLEAELIFSRKMRLKLIKIKNARCDYAYENKKSEKNILEANMNINFEYTAAGTHQQNRN